MRDFIAVENFDAEFKTASGWESCRVVGINADDFLIITTDCDGISYPFTVRAVRKPEPRQWRRVAV